MSSTTPHRKPTVTSTRRRSTPRTVNAAWTRTIAVAGRGLQALWQLRLGWIAGHAFLVGKNQLVPVREVTPLLLAGAGMHRVDVDAAPPDETHHRDNPAGPVRRTTDTDGPQALMTRLCV